ncbi:MAG: lipopolysaccharide assembly protein LapA domain-containing protein [Phycisphaeraceae bacterium]
MSTKAKVKLVIVIVSIVIAGVLVVQNRANITTNILWAEVEMPRILLLLLMLAIGFVLGAIYGGSLFKRKGK